jgi:hypothetical protein
MPQEDNGIRHPPSAQGNRKPYEKPAFQHEQVFERMALSCGKIDSTEEQCSTQASSS